MFENFNTVDFLILGTLCLTNIICIICIIFLVSKNKKNNSVLEHPEEVKVTKVNEEESTTAFDEIIEAMQKDIDSKSEDAVELFEQEQEEKAIISYQELLNAKNNKKIEINEPVVENIIEKIEEKPKATPKLVTTKETKFTNSEFVSPVFGKMDQHPKNNIEIEKTYDLEKTLNIEPLTEEIKKNNEFLIALKEFRKNL